MTIEAMKAIKMVYANTTEHDWPDDIWDAICQAIEAEKHEVSQEPVAWMYTSHYKGDERYITKYQFDLSTYKADKVWPLYTTPQPKREPLTDEQADKVIEQVEDMVGSTTYVWDLVPPRSLVRAILEAAHGIKENT